MLGRLCGGSKHSPIQVSSSVFHHNMLSLAFFDGCVLIPQPCNGTCRSPYERTAAVWRGHPADFGASKRKFTRTSPPWLCVSLDFLVKSCGVAKCSQSTQATQQRPDLGDGDVVWL